ncbi:MAG TPA: TIGR02757 family protein [Saprospiraceae bacterium]|nr:TIGR02757 family protein [Saprospiraceae bacterium]
MKIPSEVASFLLEQAWRFNQSSFIENDAISIPHSFSKKQDIEISGFWTAMLSWGNRKSIIKNCNELSRLMDYAPLDFVKNYQERDGLKFSKFVHRTFQYADSLYFLQFLSSWYKKYTSLEDAFIPEGFNSCASIESSLNLFHERFFSDDPDQMNHRTRKHVARPKSGSRCKRMNMFLRWMVRKDNRGVDFGMWNKIDASQLMIPLDIHVEKTARKYGLLQRKNLDWKAVLELSLNCSEIIPEDPGLLDYALFGLSIESK